MDMLLSWVVFLSVLGVVLPSDIYTSLIQIEQVLHTEDALANQLNDFISQEEARIKELKQIALDYQTHSKAALQDPENYLANPLNSFLLVKRFTADWQKVAGKIRNDAALDFVANVSRSLTHFPDDHDLVGSARALLRLQDTYALDTSQLAAGDIRGVPTLQKLAGDDCFELGRIAYEHGDHYHAILWFQEATKQLIAEDASHAIIAKAYDYLAFSLYKQGNIQAAVDATHEWLEYDPGNQRGQRNMEHYAEELAAATEPEEPGVIKNERILAGYRATPDFLDYEALCRGEKIKDYEHEHQLYCFYKKEHPFYKLRPLKVEIVYFDPYMQIFHDLITDTEINKVKEIATPMLHTSMMFKTTEPRYQQDDVRVSMSAWLRDSEHPLIRGLSQKVEFATGLDTIPAEAMQVLNYGLGGHYEPHLDFGQPHEDRSDLPDFRDFGNRISTSLYYMTDVAAGGATVFVDLGIHVPPEKGSMVHWYNLMKSGQGDFRTRHAGCPVLAGTKWVCNKWIHEWGQEARRPCTLNPNE